MDLLPEQIFVDIIATEMALDPASEIWVANQNKKIPNDNGLYVIVGMISEKIMSVKSFIKESGDDVIDRQEIRSRASIQIDITSRSNDALLRRYEILAAVRSLYAKQKQEELQFKILRIPDSFINASAAEGGSTLNRFTLSIPCFVWYIKEKTLTPTGGDYYDKFDTRVDDKNSIDQAEGIIEFRITAEDAP